MEVLYKKFMAAVSIAKPKGIRGGKVTHTNTSTHS